MKSLAILGASGHGKVIADAATLQGWQKIVFYDDSYPENKNNFNWPIIGNSADLIASLSQYDGVIVGIGNNKIRLEKTILLHNNNASLVSIIHPNAIISNFCKIDDGSFIAAGAIVQIDAQIGKACIINTNAVVEHDCLLSDGVHISPNAALAGGVIVKECSWIGIGAVVKQNVSIDRNVTVGAGAVVVKNVDSDTVAVGNPAKYI